MPAGEAGSVVPGQPPASKLANLFRAAGFDASRNRVVPMLGNVSGGSSVWRLHDASGTSVPAGGMEPPSLPDAPTKVVKAGSIPNAILHWFERSARGC